MCIRDRTHGFALVSEEGIKLVFRDAEDIASSPDEDAESTMIPWSNIANWEAKRGLISDSFLIQTHVWFGEEPDGKDDNQVELKLQKRDRELLDRFEKLAKQYQSGELKDDVDDVLDDVRDMLDPTKRWLSDE